MASRQSSSVRPDESGESPRGWPRTGTRSRTQIDEGSSISGVYQMRFEPPIKHVSPTNPWLPLLSPEQIVEINGAFRQFDRNGDGHISVAEIHTVMRNLGYPMTMEKAAQIAASVDADGSGAIEFDEFVGLMANRMLKSDGEEELRLAFQALFEGSVDAEGNVPIDLVKNVFCSLGSHKLREDEVTRMLGSLLGAESSAGRIPFAVFMQLECWDLRLPNGDLISMRDSKGKAARAEVVTPSAAVAMSRTGSA